jgi:hypothetical protein
MRIRLDLETSAELPDTLPHSQNPDTNQLTCPGLIR